MKCPKCNKTAYYVDKRPNRPKGDLRKDYRFIRTNFKAKCKSCEWEGEI
ncbi:MAG: hypothetical protein AABY15_03340 [Nanoarchaeota archaeon]